MATSKRAPKVTKTSKTGVRHKGARHTPTKLLKLKIKRLRAKHKKQDFERRRGHG